MKKQHGVEFEGPRCRGHNEEMNLDRFAVWRGAETHVSYMWYCPHESCEECCEEIPASESGKYGVPKAVLEAYGDPSPKFAGPRESVPVRLNPQSELDYLLFGGGGTCAHGKEVA